MVSGTIFPNTLRVALPACDQLDCLIAASDSHRFSGVTIPILPGRCFLSLLKSLLPCVIEPVFDTPPVVPITPPKVVPNPCCGFGSSFLLVGFIGFTGSFFIGVSDTALSIFKAEKSDSFSI